MRPRALLLGIALAIVPLVASGQEEASPVDPLTDLADRLARARLAVQEEDSELALKELDGLLSRAAAQREGPLYAREVRPIVAEALEWRARLAFGEGRRELASSSLRELLALRPAFSGGEAEDPRFAALVRRLRARHIGRVKVSTRPAGAEVVLDGEVIGTSDTELVDVYAGPHRLDVTRANHRGESLALEVTAGRTESVELDLVRTASSLFVVTQPKGVEVRIDGRVVGVTAGSLDPELHAAALSAGLDPRQASARLELSGLPVGRLAVELRRECSVSEARSVEIAEPGDFELPAVRLADSVGALQLVSDPAGGQILIDGRPAGLTPRVVDGVCSGLRRVEVRHSAGRFVREVEVVRGATLALECQPRPTLAYVGALGPARRTAREAELLERLSRLRTLNVVRAPSAAEVLLRDQRGLVDLSARSPLDAGEVRRLTDRLATAFEAEGLLLLDAREPDEPRLELRVLGSASADLWPLGGANGAGLEAIAASLDRPAAVFRPWTGIVAADTLLADGALVVRLVAGSPAQRAGVREGDLIVAADGRPVKLSEELERLLASKAPRQGLALDVRGAAGPRRVALEVGRSPLARGPDAENALRSMLELRLVTRTAPASPDAAFARLGLGLAALAADDVAGAHAELLLASEALPERTGVSRGTALYHLGRALARLSLRTEADAAMARAGRDRLATLEDDDGPRVADLVAPAGRPREAR